MAAKVTSKAQDLLALLDSSTADDVADIDREIEAVQAKLDGLKSARKLIAGRLGLDEPKKVRQVRTSAPAPAASANGQADGPSAAKAPTTHKILQYLAKNGPERIGTIADKLGVTYQTVYGVVTNTPAWFDKQTDGVHLTAAGQQAARSGRGGVSE